MPMDPIQAERTVQQIRVRNRSTRRVTVKQRRDHTPVEYLRRPRALKRLWRPRAHRLVAVVRPIGS